MEYRTPVNPLIGKLEAHINTYNKINIFENKCLRKTRVIKTKKLEKNADPRSKSYILYKTAAFALAQEVRFTRVI